MEDDPTKLKAFGFSSFIPDAVQELIFEKNTGYGKLSETPVAFVADERMREFFSLFSKDGGGLFADLDAISSQFHGQSGELCNLCCYGLIRSAQIAREHGRAVPQGREHDPTPPTAGEIGKRQKDIAEAAKKLAKLLADTYGFGLEELDDLEKLLAFTSPYYRPSEDEEEFLPTDRGFLFYRVSDVLKTLAEVAQNETLSDLEGRFDHVTRQRHRRNEFLRLLYAHFGGFLLIHVPARYRLLPVPSKELEDFSIWDAGKAIDWYGNNAPHGMRLVNDLASILNHGDTLKALAVLANVVLDNANDQIAGDDVRKALKIKTKTPS
jgi:hypothetical protein